MPHPQTTDMKWRLFCDECYRVGRVAVIGYVDAGSEIWQQHIGYPFGDDAPVRLVPIGGVTDEPRGRTLVCPIGHGWRRRNANSMSRRLASKPGGGDIRY